MRYIKYKPEVYAVYFRKYKRMYYNINFNGTVKIIILK